MVELSLEQIAERVREGQTEQFGTLVEQTQRELFRLAARMLGNTADAEDTLQEAYVKAYRGLVAGQFDGRSSLRTWLYRVVTNAALDTMRRRALRPVGSEAAVEAASSSDEQEARVALRELDEWLRELPPDQRAAVVLKVVEGNSSVEVAEILGCTEGAVEQRLVRARATLRQRRGSDD